jgi:tRNA pseudouridine38-40 synthase
MRRIDISRRGAYWRFEFEANAFLHHMIRNLMGCLLLVGQGLQPPELDRPRCWPRASRDAAAPTFSARRPLLPGPGLRRPLGLAGRARLRMIGLP